MRGLFSRSYANCRTAVLLVLPGLIVAPGARGQRLSFKHLGRSDGLSHAHVASILQDRLGFMWFGTQGGGLSRYDGYEFVHYEHVANDSTTIANNNITRIFEDSKGILWINSWGGLSRYDRARDALDSWYVMEMMPAPLAMPWRWNDGRCDPPSRAGLPSWRSSTRSGRPGHDGATAPGGDAPGSRNRWARGHAPA